MQVGFWMEGDSLAPPCGTEIPIIHKLLEFAGVSAQDTVYDLGCGDGRVCLEAFAKHRCASVGVEVEFDLVDRANFLLAQLGVDCNEKTSLPKIIRQDLRNVLKILVAQHSPTPRPTSTETHSDIAANDDPLPLPTVVFLYLLPDALSEIKWNLVLLLMAVPNLRIVCTTWGLPSLEPAKKGEFEETQSGSTAEAFLYTKKSLGSIT